MASWGLVGEIPFLGFCQEPDHTLQTSMDLLGQTGQSCQISSVSFLVGWKKVGMFWTESNLLHSHVGPLTGTLKLEKEYGSQSKIKFLSFTGPESPLNDNGR